MNNVDPKQQKQFFDVIKNQYAQDLITSPPYHTELEIHALLKDVKKLSKQEIIVDYGAGSGRITVPLLQNNQKVLAVDISDKSLEKIKAMTKKLGLKGLQTSYVLPNKNTAAAIVGADILHHVDLDEELPKLYASLKKGGIISFSEPCAWNLSWHIYLRIASDWEVEKRMLYCSYFNLKNSFQRHGFRNVEIEGLGALPRPFFNWSKPLSRFNDALGNAPLLNLFSYRYIIRATK